MTVPTVKPLSSFLQSEYTSKRYDVVVFGATPSGIVAAIRLAREGKKVLLISVFEQIGGMLTNGLSMMDTIYEGFRATLYEELLAKIRTYYSDKYGGNSATAKFSLFGNPADLRERPRFESHVILKIFNEWVAAEPNISLLRQFEIVLVKQKNRLIESVQLRSFQNKPDFVATARVFMDCSYEGDLLAKANVAYVVGRESRKEFGEQHAGKIFVKNIPGKADNLPKINLNLAGFGGVTQQILEGSTGEGDKSIQAYNMRFVLSADPKNRKPIAKPDNYDRNRYLKLAALQGINALAVQPVPLMNKKFNDPGLADSPDFNQSYPEAGWNERNKIIKQYIMHGLGLLYFLQSDADVPADIRKQSAVYGLPLDEYINNNNVPYEVYVREARRMRGRYVFTENDTNVQESISRTYIHEDSIAVSDWPCDTHECTDLHQGPIKEGFFILTNQTRPSQIPFRSLLPVEIDNLIVPVCLSATHVGFGSIRVEPVWMHVAESAAWACILSIRDAVRVSEINILSLQKLLVDHSIMISFFNEFDMASRERWAAAVQYFGTKGLFFEYDAHPDQPLNSSEADVWIAAAKQSRHGNNHAMDIAAILKRRSGKHSDSLVKFGEFVKKAKPANIVETDWLKIVKTFDSGFEEFILRKNACLLLYQVYVLMNLKK